MENEFHEKPEKTETTMNSEFKKTAFPSQKFMKIRLEIVIPVHEQP